ncbi:MAG: 2-C-methyl-D-erythritol 4-phosphate cytidylyltransferase [Planctomycetaceae bacterium]
MTQIAVILPAAGRSTRFASSTRIQESEHPTQETGHPAQRKKPFITLKGEPIWYRSVIPFLHRADVVKVVIAVSPEDLDWFRERFANQLARMRSIEVVAGGAERSDTVEAALRQIPESVELIAVHDAARPMIQSETIEAVVQAARRTGAAIPATPISSTIKRVGAGNRITETVPRADLWAAQTPQIVRQDWLRQAFAERGTFQPTDEAQLIERMGHPVEVVPGLASNIKITTQDDLDLAEALLK